MVGLARFLFAASGGVAVALMAGALGCTAKPVAHAVAPRASLASPTVFAGDIDARALLGDLPSRALRLGAGPASLIASRPALDNEWVGGFVGVPRDDCLLAYARASSSIEDVDLSVYSDDGTSLAADEGRDVHPTVLLCAPHPDRLYVAAHVVDGEGFVAVGAQLVPKERALSVARSLGARGTVGQGPRPADAWPGLDDAVRAHRLALGGKWEEFKRLALPVDASVPTFASMTIDAGKCIDVVVVPDEDVAVVDVEAVDNEGRVVARAGDGIGPRSLTVCSPVAMAGTISVRPHVGRGLAAVVMAHALGSDPSKEFSMRPQVAWAATVATIDVAKAGRATTLDNRGYAAALTTVAGSLPLGRRVSLPIDLRPVGAPCGRVDVIAGAPLALIDARIWENSGALLASGDAPSSLALFVCARVPARIELDTRGRPGPFAITVRTERWRDPIFAAHPLAASRMLARATTGPDMLFDGREVSARELVLEASQLVTFTESVPAGKCLQVSLGGQGEGAGIELRAIDGIDDEIDRSSAAHAVSVRACAPPAASRSIRFEARLTAGRLVAIVGERVLDP